MTQHALKEEGKNKPHGVKIHTLQLCPSALECAALYDVLTISAQTVLFVNR